VCQEVKGQGRWGSHECAGKSKVKAVGVLMSALRGQSSDVKARQGFIQGRDARFTEFKSQHLTQGFP